MTTDTLEQLSLAVDTFVRNAGMAPHVRKARIFKDRCYAIDFQYQDTAFAFDFVPAANSAVSLDFVPRGDSTASATYNAEARKGKRRVTEEAPLNVALDAFASDLARLEGLINPPATAPDAVEKAEGALTIGILTLPLSANFGNNLQAFALVDTLRNMGHRTVLINRRRPPEDHVDNDETLAACLSQPLFVDHADLAPRYLPKANARFVDRHIGPTTPVFHSSQQLSAAIDRYGVDAVIVGSDQTWRPNYASTLLGDFFLGFLDRSATAVRRISYAASFGADRWEYSSDARSEVAPLLQKFDAVSVREDNAVDLCRMHLGRDALHVLDPTLLVSPDRYVEVFSEVVAPQTQDRLVTYILDTTSDKDALLSALSEHMDIPVHSTNGQPYASGDPLKQRAGDNSIERWLASIHGAALFVTDSFHGMVFSIIFQRPFIVYANPRRGMARFTSLLKLLGLEDRLVTQASDIVPEQALKPIDWDSVNDRLEAMRQSSMAFLESALNTPAGARPSGGEPVKKADAVANGFVEGARRLALLDSKRFSAAYQGGDPISKARAVLMFDAHALEKGLSHTSFRPGFGNKALTRLAKETRSWMESGGSLVDPFFIAAISAIHAYFQRHRALDFDTTQRWRLFSPEVQVLITRSDTAHGGALMSHLGREPVPAMDDSRTFLSVVYGRRSVREYNSDPIDLDAIRQAVRIASQSPSVCNRQGPRAHYISDPETITKLVDIQGGFSGYPRPPGLLLVTCDLTAFIYHTERNQGYIDGGLFMMTLLLGLEQAGLAACPLNAAMDSRRERAIREILPIQESEILISFIAIGNHDPDVLVARSLRYPVDRLLTIHGAKGQPAHE